MLGVLGFLVPTFFLGVFQESKGHKAERRTWLLDTVQALSQRCYLKSDLEQWHGRQERGAGSMEGGRQLGSIAPWDLSLSWLGQQLALQPSGLHSSRSCAQKPSPESAFSLLLPL